MTWTNSLAALAAREFLTHPERDIEQTDCIHQGFDAAQARFLTVTAITHHRFSSPIWGRA
jgi:isocitrate dehydrogenase kinase/phosphatase